MSYDYDTLRKFATERQSEYLSALQKYGNTTDAGKAMGVTRQTINKSMSYVLKKFEESTGIGKNRNRRKGDLPVSILVLPDAQVKPDEDLAFLHCHGKYIVDKQPDVIVCIGDFADMQSLSMYDKGKRCYEGRRYKNDIEAAITGMKILLNPLKQYNLNQVKKGKKEYRPKMVFILGNHEDRINRATQIDSMLYGTIAVEDLKYSEYGWDVIPFLKVKIINGVAFSHYFTSGPKGLPITTAQALLTKKHMSCIAGHQQGLQTATAVRADGITLTAIIAGSGYEHDEDYLGAQGNSHWRGVIMLHNVLNGQCDPVIVPNSYLLNRYNPEGKTYFTAPEEGK